MNDARPGEPARRSRRGIANLERHVNNVRNHYGLPVRGRRSTTSPPTPTAEDRSCCTDKLAHHGAPVVRGARTGPTAAPAPRTSRARSCELCDASPATSSLRLRRRRRRCGTR
ncbi:MAG: hypothetical protein MZW92_48015 [Comamonadaceae bacterium]|nr:hypothetical protein [Comamonadaceae bacterium]